MHFSTKIKGTDTKGETKILSYVTADGNAIMQEYHLLGCDTMYVGRNSLTVHSASCWLFASLLLQP
jgi:hypothetical protein